eukprot:6548928-Pyramimonas_sp.AAC.1
MNHQVSSWLATDGQSKSIPQTRSRGECSILVPSFSMPHFAPEGEVADVEVQTEVVDPETGEVGQTLSSRRLSYDMKFQAIIGQPSSTFTHTRALPPVLLEIPTLVGVFLQHDRCSTLDFAHGLTFFQARRVALKWYSSATQLIETVCEAFPAKVTALNFDEIKTERERQLEYQRRAHQIRQAAAMAKMEEARRLVRTNISHKSCVEE